MKVSDLIIELEGHEDDEVVIEAIDEKGNDIHLPVSDVRFDGELNKIVIETEWE